MNNKWHIKLAEKRLAESIQGVYTIVIGNTLLFLILIFLGGESFLEDKNAHFSLLSLVFIYVALKLNNWGSRKDTLLISLVYIAITSVELVMVGLPEGYIPKGEFSKGMFLEIILMVLPLLYMAMRFSLIIVVLPVFMKQKKVKEVRNAEII